MNWREILNLLQTHRLMSLNLTCFIHLSSHYSTHILSLEDAIFRNLFCFLITIMPTDNSIVASKYDNLSGCLQFSPSSSQFTVKKLEEWTIKHITWAGGDWRGLLSRTKSVNVVKNRKVVGMTVILLHEKSSLTNFNLHISKHTKKTSIDYIWTFLQTYFGCPCTVEIRSKIWNNIMCNNNIIRRFLSSCLRRVKPASSSWPIRHSNSWAT